MTTAKYTRTTHVEALQVDELTDDTEIAAFAPDYRVPAWMRRARGWLVKDEDNGEVGWVSPETFATKYRLREETQ